ncbi:hypothetical protein [Polyangium mundeleinium]|uniref:PEGA domain-containing protein n=1 Tax=Polyangium mundeleinium TaxID=2995306 RepID=A0ABT5F185_9BACT|nr:hypothetical protein [Polyangium mundeleinium]MDC0746845.1 hypothetical protein [Polyangium mundeleinium]
MRSSVLGFVAGAALLLGAIPEASADGGQASVPDIVLLKDGGMLRGTIVEKDPEGSVTILLPSGKSRTVDMDDVTYAGAESARPKAKPDEDDEDEDEDEAPARKGRRSKTKPFITVKAGEASLKLESDEPNATYHVRSGSAYVVGSRGSAVGQSFTEICTAPCEASLPVGTHYLALSKQGGVPVLSADPVRLDGPSRIVGSYTSNAGTRMAGLGVLVGGIVVGGVVMLVPIMTRDPGEEFSSAPLVIGGVLLLGGTFGGMLLMMRRDDVKFEITPLEEARGGPTTPRATMAALPARGITTGAGLRVSF